MFKEQIISFDVKSIELSKFSSLLSKLSVSQKEIIYLVAKERINTLISSTDFIELIGHREIDKVYQASLENFHTSLMRHPSFLSIQAIEDGSISLKTMRDASIALVVGTFVMGFIKGVGVDVGQLGENAGIMVSAEIQRCIEDIEADPRLLINNVLDHQDDGNNRRFISSSIQAIREEDDKFIITLR